jgi:hypothetical protein
VRMRRGGAVGRSRGRAELRARGPRPCHPGPEGTEGVGACKAGAQTCEAAGSGVSTGAVVPTADEDCHTPHDEDCDGRSDDCPDVAVAHVTAFTSDRALRPPRAPTRRSCSRAAADRVRSVSIAAHRVLFEVDVQTNGGEADLVLVLLLRHPDENSIPSDPRRLHVRERFASRCFHASAYGVRVRNRRILHG